jgi:hypothetical protein
MSRTRERSLRVVGWGSRARQLAHLNWFLPNLTEGTYSSTYWDALRLCGVSFFMGPARVPAADRISTARIELPHKVIEKEPAVWQIYELRGPNLGDFSPTEIKTAGTAAEIMAALARPNFDFGRQAVIESVIGAPLTPARDMGMTRIRGSVMYPVEATARRWPFFRSNSATACARAMIACALCARTC